MNAFFEQLAKLGPARLIIMFGVTVGVAGALMTVSMRLGDDHKALLFSGLELSEMGDITSRLEQSNIAYELGGGGSAVFVAADSVAGARMMLAADGLPSAGSVGYEIFDQQSTLGSTRFVQDVNRLRALEGELARTIRALDGVAGARVHLALPERRLFSSESEDATASVWIELRQSDLAARHARAIRNLVGGAVPGLRPSRVTILDDEGRLLADGAGEDAEGEASLIMDDRRASIEERIRRQVIDIVESIVGSGSVRAQVSADVDFNRISESSEIFDPQGRVVRSTTTVQENSNEADRENAAGVSASANIPGASDADEGGPTSQAETSRNEETINYEISRTSRTQVHEVGAIRRLSVAVAVDGVTQFSEDGEMTYEPRSDEVMGRIDALVRSAIGFEAERGDSVEVANVQFARGPLPDAGTPEPSRFSFNMNDIMRGAELFVLLIVAIMIIFLVVRPLLKGALSPTGAPALASRGAGGAQLAVSANASGATLPTEGAAAALPAPGGSSSGIDIEKIDGQLRASSVKQVSEVVSSHPDESVAILRTWLHES